MAGFCLLLAGNPLLAQNRTITGKVVDEKGNPVPYASVQIKGSNKGVTADEKGNYSIEVPTGRNVRLLISSVGFGEVEVAADGSASQVALKSGDALGEVVVTAFGVKQKKKAIGFVTQELKNDEILESRQPNLVNAMQGRVAGVQINSTGGGPGQGARILIRGVKSLAPGANNQPLFVIDGIVMDNSTNTEFGSAALRGMSNRAVDINPDDVESMTVLRGGAATALYGIGGANGVILITTKSGKAGKMRIDFSSSYGIEEVNKFPEVQSTYTQGYLGVYNRNDFFPSFGPTVAAAKAIDPTHPDQLYNHYARAYEQGYQIRNSLSVTGGTEKALLAASMAYNYHKGVLPNTDFTSIHAKVGAQFKISNKLAFNPTILYTNSGGTRYNADRFNESLTYWSPRWDVRDYRKPDGTMNTYGNNNPIFGAYENLFVDNVDRLITNMNLVYTPTSWLNFNYRFGMDNTADSRRTTKPGPRGVAGEIALSDGGLLGVSGALGSVGEYRLNNRILNSNLIITANKNWTDKFNTTFRLGNEIRDRKFSNVAAEGAELDIPDLLSLNNAKVRSNQQRIEKERSVSFWGDVTLGWDNFVFLNGSLRNDRVSNLPVQNNSFFYPSVSLSYVFSQHLKLPSWVTYGKLRGSYSVIGIGAPTPYLTNTYYSNPFGQPIGAVIPWSREDSRGDPNLKPEFTVNREIGAELRFLKNRLGVDVTYYVINSKDLIVPILVSTASGFNSVVTNAGEIQNKGWEITLNGTPVQTRDFKWDIDVNLTNNTNKVLKVSAVSNEIILGTSFGYLNSGVTQKYVVGQPVGGLYGTSYQRFYGTKPDDRTTLQADLPWVIQGGTGSQRGYPARDLNQRLLGNSQPRWIGGINNSFTWKNISLGLLFDFRTDYQRYNQLGNFMSAFGIAKYTENRNDVVTFPGVLADGTPNTQAVWLGQGIGPDGRNYADGFYRLVHRGVSENFVEDADWFRLRTLSLAFQFPSSMLARAKVIQSASLTFTGNNLWLKTPYTGYDPETGNQASNSNADGFSGFSFPGVRSYFLTLNVSFQ